MGQGIVCGGPGACGGFIGVFHFGIHKMAGQPGVHIVHFQLQAVLQGIGAALLGNQRFADQTFQLFKQFRRDLGFNLFPHQASFVRCALKAEHQRGAAALQCFAPDAHCGAHADVPLVHAVSFQQGKPLGPALHHPFAFNFHGVHLALS